MSDADSITREEAIAEVVRLRSEVAYLTFNRDHLAAANKSMHAELVALRAALGEIAALPVSVSGPYVDAQEIARAALAGAGETKPNKHHGSRLEDFLREEGVHPDQCAAEPASASPNIAESNDRADAEAMCRLLASIWFYGAWHPETSNERSLQAILERRGWWPITEDALIAKARIAAQPPAAPATEDKA